MNAIIAENLSKEAWLREKFYEFYFDKNGEIKTRYNRSLTFIINDGSQITLLGKFLSFVPDKFYGAECVVKDEKGKDKVEKWIEISLSDVHDIVPI